MVSLKKKIIKEKAYHYLVYSYREGGKVQTIEKEIGKDIPLNLGDIKEEFITTVVEKRWVKNIEDVKESYNEKLKILPDFIKAEHLREFGIRFTHNTNKIEGSTLTLREVGLIIDKPEIPISKPTYDILEAKLHMQCYEEMIKKADTTALTMDLIKGWHKTLFSLHINRNNFAGLIRKGQVFISSSNYVPPPGGLVCEDLIEKSFNWYNNKKNTIHPVLIACLMHYKFVSIHPFDDGNGRMARLLTNFILLKKKYPMFDIPAKIRKSYYNALERANLKEDEMIFVGWFFKNYIKSLKSLRLPS